MLRCFRIADGRLHGIDRADGATLSDDAIWIDLFEPTDAERVALEEALALALPAREEVSEIQTSSRLTAKDGTLFMTALVAHGQDMEPLQTPPVTFVRHERRVVTIRYEKPEAIDQFVERAGSGEWQLQGANDVLAAMLETIVDRIADRLEFIGGELKRIERTIFRREIADPDSWHRLKVSKRIHALQDAIERIGIHHMQSSGLRECLHSLQRLIVFRRNHANDQKVDAHFGPIEEDLRAIADYDQDLNNSMDFMVNATVGLIDVQQNKVIYVLSIMSMVLTPPVVIASIYGMNFDVMPELHWRWGYGFALALMLGSAFVPWVLFKFKRWL